MKKVILCVSVAALLGVTLKIATAKEPTTSPAISKTTTAINFDDHVAAVYQQIDFRGKEKLSFDAFATAYRGYLNLRNAGKLNSSKPVLTVADFTLSSTKQRMWIIDMAQKKVLFNDYVAHGQGSGNEFATQFSNTTNSHQSSIGFYVTAGEYVGKHGNSLRLRGMDEGYNSAALERAIVVHGADYVSSSFVKGQNRLGRSWGCPAVSNQAIGKVIDYIGDGTCLFIYYPQKNYLASSAWLNRKIDRLPEEIMEDGRINPVLLASNGPVKYEYAANAQDLNPESPYYISPEERVMRQKLMALNLGFVERILP